MIVSEISSPHNYMKVEDSYQYSYTVQRVFMTFNKDKLVIDQTRIPFYGTGLSVLWVCELKSSHNSASSDLLSFLFLSWKIHIDGPEATLYEGEQFTLQFLFNSKYPFDSPQVSSVV